MKKSIICLLLIMICQGCVMVAPPHKQPVSRIAYIDMAAWISTTKEKVYAVCLTVLHVRGYNINTIKTSKDNGIIVTEFQQFTPAGFPKAKVTFEIAFLITEGSESQILLRPRASILKVIGPKDSDIDALYATINNEIGSDVNAIVNELVVLLGPTVNIIRQGFVR